MSESEIFPDVGCIEASKLWELNKQVVDPLRSALLERHRQESNHAPDCFVNQKASPT